MELSPRIVQRIARDFGKGRASQVTDLLSGLDLPGRRTPDGDERVCGAILILADGDVDRLVRAAADAELDWRDVLVAAGLGDDDWREKLDRALDPTRPS